MNKTAYDIIEEIFEKIAAENGFYSGKFSANTKGTSNNFGSGSFSKATVEEEKPEEKVYYSTRIKRKAQPKQEAKEEKKEDNTVDPREQVSKAMSSVTKTEWYKALPQSLQSQLGGDMMEKSTKYIEDGMTPLMAGTLMATQYKASIDKKMINKFKYMDELDHKVRSSDMYNEEYNKGTAKKTGPKWGAGIGALAGAGLGAMNGKVPGALLGAGLAGGAGALIGRGIGSSIDSGEAFSATQGKVAPGYGITRQQAYDMYNKSMK